MLLHSVFAIVRLYDMLHTDTHRRMLRLTEHVRLLKSMDERKWEGRFNRGVVDDLGQDQKE